MMKIFLFFMSLNFLSLFIYKNLLFNIIYNMMFFSIIFLLINYNFLNYYWLLISNNLGMDSISFILMLMTIWIMSLSMMIFKMKLKNFNIMFINMMILLMNILLMSFSTMNIMIFYIIFETSLIPMMLIIMGWGYQIDRIQASMYMLMYTLIGSLPLLFMIIYIYFYLNSLSFNILNMINKYFFNINILMFFMMNLAFFIKMPMYLTHLWLPKAHVEAPIMGSMILAGIMLKLGTYGIYRFIMMFPLMYMKYKMMMIIFSLFGSLISSMICMNHMDMKIIVAYSSIVHMNFLLASMLTLSSMGMKGSLMMMIAHALCSSLMFFIVNLFYQQMKSRNLFMNKSLINFMPSLTLWWFLNCSNNFAAPPSLNLFSEIFMINSLMQLNIFMLPLIILISFFSTCYSIFIYSFSQYGKISYYYYNFKNLNCKIYLMIILHWLPLNIMFLNMNLIYFKLFLIFN